MQEVTETALLRAHKTNPWNPGRAADRVILTPCSLAPYDPSTLPFMSHRAIVKTLEVPHDSFYLDRNLQARVTASRRGVEVPPHDFDFTRPYSRVEQLGNGLSDGPTLQPLCIQLLEMPKGTDGYRLLATNCYFFSRTIFRALKQAYRDHWNPSLDISEDGMVWAQIPNKPWKLTPVSTLTKEAGEKLTPLQKAALWINDKLANSEESEVGALMRQTAANMADGMMSTRLNAELTG